MIMREEHKQQCLDLTSEIFGKYEPAGQLIGVTPEIFKGAYSNLFDYLIRRGEAITVKDIYLISRDILLSLYHLHANQVYHLGLNPLSLQVLKPLDDYF